MACIFCKMPYVFFFFGQPQRVKIPSLSPLKIMQKRNSLLYIMYVLWYGDV